MKNRLFYLLLIFVTSSIFSQGTSSIIYETGTNIEIGDGADVCADVITVNGTSSGNGTFCDSPVGVDEVDLGIPSEFVLEQNYPNPFNPATTIRFSISSASRVNITVSNVLGQQVMELVNDIRSAGNHEITFNANNLATGVYLYKINAISIDGKTSFTNTRKMILMK
ncbi:hypothetical protein ASZ90_003931 [hydrocarbon metagenome]|uniref:Secretion system C-terminal sorting domain-containing protein n=1 Tax=hydrocarbon metagenome TaxID=938273 RepID=A0A0W8FZB4_9ZZZZ